MQRETGTAGTRQICHINLAAGFRGGERQTELLIRGLAVRGWPQRLVVRNGSALATRCRGIPGLRIVEVLSHAVSAAFAARGSALVHAHEARAVYAGWLLKRTGGTPFVLTRRVHASNGGSFARKRAYRAADCVVAVSSSIAASVEAHHPGVPCRTVHSAHAGMSDGRTVTRDALQELAGKTIVGHVGELDHSHKGQGTLIEAARMLRDSHPELHFVLVGEGRDEEAFRSLAEGLDNVEFAGFVTNVEDYLAAFDVFLFPSLQEGLGSTLLDAMSFGLPIVATRVGGIPEIVEEGVNGLLVTPGRPAELAEALRRVLRDDGLRASMSAENRKKAAQFGADRMIDAYESIYRSMLAQ